MQTLADLNRVHALEERRREALAWALCRGLHPEDPYGAQRDLARRGFATKAVAPPITTTGDPPQSPFGTVFLPALQRLSAFDGLGFLKAPANVPVGVLTSSLATATWVAEAGPVPMYGAVTNLERLTPGKLALGCVLSRELAERTEGDALNVAERILLAFVAAGTDCAVFDPNTAGSITNGLSPVSSLGGSLGADVAALVATISNGTPTRPVLVLGSAAARALFFSNEEPFGSVTLVGAGAIGGARTFTSPCAAISDYVIAIDSDGIVTCDEGLELSPAREAAVQLSDSPAAGAQSLISLWENNLIGLIATRFVGWQRRADAVAWMSLAGSP